MIYYEKYGNEFNPVVILLHDSESVYCFSKECDYLSRNYCAIVPHLPGFGRNPEKMFSAESALEQTAERWRFILYAKTRSFSTAA